MQSSPLVVVSIRGRVGMLAARELAMFRSATGCVSAVAFIGWLPFPELDRVVGTESSRSSDAAECNVGRYC
jgi:hypothetical protein